MNRRPWWPIALGVTVWGAAIYTAVVGPWWPLAVVATVSLVPGAIVGGVVMMTRGARRDAQAMAQQAADADRSRPARNEPVAEPPATRPSAPRTNAKTAGRRRGGPAMVLGLLAAAAPSQGCEKIERARAERRAREAGEAAEGVPTPDAPTGDEVKTPATPTPPATPAPSPTGPAGEQALAAALVGAITPPDGLEATWRVDPFVAALLVEQLRHGVGPTFTPIAAPIPEGPSAGFRVGDVPDGSLLHRLGLRTGDVIETVGGVVLSDVGRIGFALDGAENRVDVMVFRDGISTMHSYRLAQGLAWRSLLAAFPPGTAAIGGTAAAGSATGSDAPGGGAVDDGGATSGRGGASSGGSAGGGSAGGGSGGGGSAGGGSAGGGSAGGGSAGGGSGAGGTTPSASDPVRCESSSRCTVAKSYFNKMVASPSALSAQANIVPAIANDVHSGYKLKSVKAGSAIAKLGFRAGDKVTHVNGVDLTDDLAAFGLLADLSGTSLFRIRYERGGSAATKTVVVE